MFIKYIDKYFLKKPALRKFITKLLEGNKDLVCSILNSDFHLHSIKEHGYLRTSRLANKSAFLRDELPVLFNLVSLIEEGDTFLDVGANIGLYSIFISRLNLLNKNIRINAFEANPDTYKRLKKNANKHNFSCKNIAISDRMTTLNFVEGAVSHVFTTIENESAYNFSKNIIKVASSTLSKQQIFGNSIIIKIDVEGQEINVLNGADELFLNNRVKAVFIDGYSDPDVPILLHKHSFKLFNANTLGDFYNKGGQLLAIKKSL